MRYKARTDDVAWRVVEGEGVLVHAESSAYFGLNRTGTALWEALANAPCTTDELVHGLTERFAAPSHQAMGDVDTFLASLVGAGLVTEAQDGSAKPPANGQVLDVRAGGLYEPPQLSPFGELEQLILSGE